MRRKRNLDLSRFRSDREKDVHSIDDYLEQDSCEEIEEEYEVESEQDLDVEYEEVEELEDEDEYNSERENPTFMIDGKPFVPKKMGKKQSFNDTHVRVTTYLEKNIHQIVHIMQKQGQIESITKFVNDSIKDYLMKKYHQED